MKPLQIAIALDQLANTLMGGWADETISSRAWRCRSHSKFWHYSQKAIDKLFFWQDQHCRRAYLSEVFRHHFPKHYRK